MSTADGWTADNTKASYLGMTAHWIKVDKEKWSLCSEVVGFQAISGEYNGWNLGRYFVGLCDHVGICSTGELKISYTNSFVCLFCHLLLSHPILFYFSSTQSHSIMPQTTPQPAQLSNLYMPEDNTNHGVQLTINFCKWFGSRFN